MVWQYSNEEFIELVALVESKFSDDKSKKPMELMESWRISIEELMESAYTRECRQHYKWLIMTHTINVKLTLSFIMVAY